MKKSIRIETTEETKARIKEAATRRGLSLTAFIIMSALEKADQVLS
jgi:uncharacterized protein (DUF1778 family)